MTIVEQVFAPRLHDVGGLNVGRVLPFRDRRMIGPFIFLDHIGPATMPAGQALDVRPHPHIGLSTLTYLFEGGIFHRDNLGNALEIMPGAVNWMTAGRGIAHSERTPPDVRGQARRLHGLQFWVALPKSDEEIEPEFWHYAADAFPVLQRGGVTLRVIAGTAYGEKSPVKIYSPLCFVDVEMPPGSALDLPDDHSERAIYVIDGGVEADGRTIDAHNMAVFKTGAAAAIAAKAATHVVIAGGEPFPEPRHIWWNFVSSSEARIEQAKRDWRDGRFSRIPGDDQEFIPLPE